MYEICKLKVWKSIITSYLPIHIEGCSKLIDNYRNMYPMDIKGIKYLCGQLQLRRIQIELFTNKKTI